MNLNIPLTDLERIAQLAFDAANNRDNYANRHKDRDVARRFAKAIAESKAYRGKVNL